MVVKGFGYFLLAIITFIFALQLTFPYHRVKDKVVEVLSAKYDTKIGGIERSIVPGRFTLTDITLRSRPAKSDEVPTTFFIKSLEIDVGILAGLSQTAEVDIEATIGSGTIAGSISISKDGTKVHIIGADLQANMLPMREGIGLPMAGAVKFSVDLDLPNEKAKTGKVAANWEKAAGSFSFACPAGCIFGDGQSKLKAKLSNSRNAAFAADGIEFGKVNVQTLAMKVDINKGVMTLSQMDMKSLDGELNAQLSVQLAPTLDDSDVTGCLRFAGTKALLEREAKTYTAITATGAPLGPDKLYHIKLDGKFKEIKRRGVLCGPGISDQNMDDGNAGSGKQKDDDRPSITIQGDSPLSPDGGTGSADMSAANPPPPEQIDAGTPDAAVTVPESGPVNEKNDPPPPQGEFAPQPPPENIPPPENVPLPEGQPLPEGDQQQPVDPPPPQ